MRNISRREFTKSSAAATALAPWIVTGRKSQDSEVVIGQGNFRYRVRHAWPQLPTKYSWQVTHNVAVDDDNNLYVIHEGDEKKKEHPSIFVFDEKGKFVRSFGQQFQGGGHGIEVRKEGRDEFLYVCAYQSKKTFAKLTLQGETVWQKFAPMEAGVYAQGEDINPQRQWGRDRFMPTNFAFAADGGFLLADGYGSYYVHRYDKDANWVGCFGGPGKGKGKFNTPHGIWTDTRQTQPTLMVCDRAHHTVQRLSCDGKHMATLKGFGLPANIDTYGDLAVVPELRARVTLLDGQNRVAARLGDDVERITSRNGNRIRNNQSDWKSGKFIHPHDACFDRSGNIFVAEWVNGGRITKLERIT